MSLLPLPFSIACQAKEKELAFQMGAEASHFTLPDLEM